MPESPMTDIIASEGTRLLTAARVDPERGVPQYPAWTLRDLVTHVASIHGRTIEVCETLPSQRVPAPALPEGRDPLDWYAETLPAMIVALERLDPVTPVWFFTPGGTISSWRRRMLIETGVHRWDAQQALGEPEPLLEVVAVNGLDEFGDMWLARIDTELPALELVATDVGRSWRFGAASPEASIAGTASDLFLRLMSRPGPELPEAWEAAIDGLATPAG